MSDLCDPWTTACQAPRPMGFPRQEYWSGLLFPPPGDLSEPGIELRSLALQVDSLLIEPPGKLTMCLYFIAFITVSLYIALVTNLFPPNDFKLHGG